MNTLVSICIPTYNGEEFIAEAMASAINQTYRPLEIIVSDDNSQDKTIEIIESFKNKTDIEISIYKHVPLGIGANWNNCVKQAKGEFIKFLFQDDLLAPTCIEEMLQPFFKYKNMGLSFCRRNIIYDKNNIKHQKWVSNYGNLHKYWNNLQSFQRGKTLLHDPGLLNFSQNKVGEPVAVLLRKKVFRKVGYFNLSLKQALDCEYWYRVFTKFNVAFINKELVSFRLHPKQATAVNAKTKTMDYAIYPRSIYSNCFWHLNPSVRYKLFMKYSLIGRTLNKIRAIIKK